MKIDVHTMQKWVAGAELALQKKRSFQMLERVVGKRTHSESIDLTRARDFSVNDGIEDVIVASMKFPVIGRKSVGNDFGIALGKFTYTDEENDTWTLLAICAYQVSGMVAKERDLKQVLLLAMDPTVAAGGSPAKA